jgi:small GTP-binding protein
MEHFYKICFLGNSGVGKTTLIQRYLSGSFNESTRLTLGVEFHVKDLIVDNDHVTLQIWDFGGEERFRFILPSYCRRANGAIFMYDITDPRSLLDIGEWLKILWQNAGQIPVLLVGTKKDLESERKIPPKEVKQIGITHKVTEFLEASAKTGENVELIFEKISRILIPK